MSADPHYEGGLPISLEGKNSVEVPAQKLSIIWGRDSRYWRLPKTEGDPAELLQVCWLEVTGSVKDTNPTKSYEVEFNLSLTPDAFGWSREYCPLSIMTKRGNSGKTLWKRTPIDKNNDTRFVIKGKVVHPSQDESSNTLYFGLYEIWSGKWKGGLKIHHAFVKEV